MLFGIRRQKLQKQKPELQRLSSDESDYSSAATSSKTTYRSSSFNGWSSAASKSLDLDSDVCLKPCASMTTDILSMSSGSSALEGVECVDTNDCSQECKVTRAGVSGGADKSGCIIDLIRQLSFSPSRKTKKRTDTAETDVTSASDAFDPSPHDEHDTSHVGLNLDRIEALRRDSPSPLLGLQYLPGDGNMYI